MENRRLASGASYSRRKVSTGTPPNPSVGTSTLLSSRWVGRSRYGQALAGRNGIENTIWRVSSVTLTSEPSRAPARHARTRLRAYSRAAASSLRSAALSCASALSARTVKKYCGIWTPTSCRPDNRVVASARQQSQRKLKASAFWPAAFEQRCQEIVWGSADVSMRGYGLPAPSKGGGLYLCRTCRPDAGSVCLAKFLKMLAPWAGLQHSISIKTLAEEWEFSFPLSSHGYFSRSSHPPSVFTLALDLPTATGRVK
jgi:hypothetical protein